MAPLTYSSSSEPAVEAVIVAPTSWTDVLVRCYNFHMLSRLREDREGDEAANLARSDVGTSSDAIKLMLIFCPSTIFLCT